MLWGLGITCIAVFVVAATWIARRNTRVKRPSDLRGAKRGLAFFVEVHDRISDADLSVHAQALFGARTPTFRLSVHPSVLRSGQVKWRGKDHWGQWHDLHALSAPAVLVIAEDTLPLLRDSTLWVRVHDVENR